MFSVILWVSLCWIYFNRVSLCHKLSVVIPSVIMVCVTVLSVICLNVILLSVTFLNVVLPCHWRTRLNSFLLIFWIETSFKIKVKFGLTLVEALAKPFWRDGHCYQGWEDYKEFLNIFCCKISKFGVLFLKELLNLY